MPSDCPDENRLAAFMDGKLASDERELVEAHLDGCSECFELVSEGGQAGAPTRKSPSGPVPARLVAGRDRLLAQATMTGLQLVWLVVLSFGRGQPGAWLFGGSTLARALDAYAAVWSTLGLAVSTASVMALWRGVRGARSLSQIHALASLPTLVLAPAGIFVLLSDRSRA